MGDNKRKPDIRFQGFTDDWEQRKFSDVVDIGSGMDYKHLGEGDIPVYGTGGYMLSVDAALSEDKDAIGIGRKGTIDKPYILRAPFWTVDTLFYCIPKDGYDLDFISCLFQNVDWRKKDESTGVPSLSKVIINNVETAVPSFEEQRKIGDYFKGIDNLITLQQRKYDKLVNVKKSMLEKMFPREGARVPEIRFEGFTDDWEQRELSSLCEKFTDGDWIESKDQSDSGIRLVQTGNVGVARFLDKPNNQKWISEDTFYRLHCEEVFPGDILISRLPEPAGRACIMPVLTTKMITAVDCTIVRTMQDVSNKFLVQYLSSQDYFKEVNTCLAGGTRQRISRSNLADFVVPVPVDKDEQDRIGNYFESLDNLITLQQRKLEKLKNIKKSMLEKMFV